MRGSNVTLYRFFEDSQRGDKPWRQEWVRRLHRAFRDMHWNSLRYCIGFPPEAWYRIADEEGFLIQDEFPIWNMDSPPKNLDSEELAREFTEWMQERWNHPCLALWDSCNETRAAETGQAIGKVRGLDFSGRPWDNGYGSAQTAATRPKLHPYHFCNPLTRLSNIGGDPGTAGVEARPQRDHRQRVRLALAQPGRHPHRADQGTSIGTSWAGIDDRAQAGALRPVPRRRDGTVAVGADCAGVLHFCSLGYSRPDGQTSDHWADVEKLTWESEFATYVRDAFAPVGIMLNAWAETYPMGKTQTFTAIVINDLYEDWRGTVQLRLSQRPIGPEQAQRGVVAALGKEKFAFDVQIPNLPGDYRLEAALLHPSEPTVRSLRDFRILSEAQRRGAGEPGDRKAGDRVFKHFGGRHTSPAAIVDG